MPSEPYRAHTHNTTSVMINNPIYSLIFPPPSPLSLHPCSISFSHTINPLSIEPTPRTSQVSWLWNPVFSADTHPSSPFSVTSDKARIDPLPMPSYSSIQKQASPASPTPILNAQKSPPSNAQYAIPLPTPPLEPSLNLCISSPAHTAPSDKGPASPCSPTSTTHLATPEWASPDLSFRGYLNLISINTAAVESTSDTNTTSGELGSNWTKRSLSMSSLGVPFIGIAANVGKRQRQRQSMSAENVRVSSSEKEYAAGDTVAESDKSARRGPPESIYISFPAIEDSLDDERSQCTTVSA